MILISDVSFEKECFEDENIPVYAELVNCLFDKCILKGVLLSGTSIINCRFNECEFVNSEIEDSILYGVEFISCIGLPAIKGSRLHRVIINAHIGKEKNVLWEGNCYSEITVTLGCHRLPKLADKDMRALQEVFQKGYYYDETLKEEIEFIKTYKKEV